MPHVRPPMGVPLGIAAVLSLLLLLLPVMADAQEGEPEVLQLRADSPVSAAIAWSQLTHPDDEVAAGDGPTEAVVGRADLFADNLTAGVLQGGTDTGRPLLLTGGDALDAAVSAELERLAVDRVLLLGGELALAPAVQTALQEADIEVERLSGVTRTETAIAVADLVDADTAILARSHQADGSGDATQAFADSIAAGALAADLDLPILFTRSQELTPSTAEHLQDAGYSDVLVVGGDAAVAPEVVDAVEAMGIEVQRLGGQTRFETAIAVAAHRGFTSAEDADLTILVDGQADDAWVDGFTAATLAGAGPYPVVLSNQGGLPAPTAAFLTGVGTAAFAADVDGVVMVCGPSAAGSACAAGAAIVGGAVVDHPRDGSTDPDPEPTDPEPTDPGPTDPGPTDPPTDPEPEPEPSRFTVDALSTRADFVSDSQVLVRVDHAGGRSLDGLTATLDGADVTDAFGVDPDHPDDMLGLVTGLPLGDSKLVVTVPGADSQTLSITNHPDEGPVFSGPHIPMYCTADGEPWNLGEVDEDCHVDGETVTYQYRTTDGSFAPLPDGPRPDDLAMTTTTDGDTVPYIVRLTRGTLNRAVYETAILHDPAGPLPDPWTRTAGWNSKLVYTFGGACGVTYSQSTSTGGVMNDTLLSRGYATASSTFNVFANNCSDVTSAETAMMVKERFIETYGADSFTLGTGGSAGTMQQLLIANAYPGIIDGVVGQIGYPDERTTTVNGHSCRQLNNYFAAASLTWTAEQIQAVQGFAVPYGSGGFGNGGTCGGFMLFDGVDYPGQAPGPFPTCTAVPVQDRWSAINPDGIRCAIADMVSAVYGTDEDGYGRRVEPDGVGIQYGLVALQDGTITVDQFLDLNESIGGIDINGNPTDERSEADPIALERAYATGRVNQFTDGLTSTPVVEVRTYSDLGGDFHDRIRSWMMRERIVEATGDHDTHVSITGPGALGGDMYVMALEAVDAWVSEMVRLEEEQPELAPERRVEQARPAGLADGCLDGDGDVIAEEIAYDDPNNTCNLLYPYHSDPQVQAGAPLAGDVLKCQLVDPVRADYPELTDEQWDRLLVVFEQGVCDWDVPGVGEVPLEGTWLRF